MTNENVINNVNIAKLPESVRDNIIDYLYDADVISKLVLYSQIVHGIQLFKCSKNDLFGITPKSTSTIYRNFISTIQDKMQAS